MPLNQNSVTITLHWQPITTTVTFLICLVTLRRSVLASFQHLFLLAHTAIFLNNERNHVSVQAHTKGQFRGRIINPIRACSRSQSLGYANQSSLPSGQPERSAQAVLRDLDKTQRTSYTDLVAALDGRFGTSNRTEMFRVSLQSRIRKPEETLPELAQAIQRLTRQAYPDATVSLCESIAKDQFIEALADPELRWKVHQAKAVTLTEALDAAVEVEAFFSAEKQQSSKPRYCRRSLLRVLGQRTQPLDKRYRSSRQWFSVWPSILAVHPIPHPTVGRGPQFQHSVGCVGPRDTFNTTALNASKIGFVHHPLSHFSHLRNVRETRHRQVQGPKPDRTPNTMAHLPISKKHMLWTLTKMACMSMGL